MISLNTNCLSGWDYVPCDISPSTQASKILNLLGTLVRLITLVTILTVYHAAARIQVGYIVSLSTCWFGCFSQIQCRDRHSNNADPAASSVRCHARSPTVIRAKVTGVMRTSPGGRNTPSSLQSTQVLSSQVQEASLQQGV